jgi:hypothetical protein
VQPLTFYFDRNFGNRLPNALASLQLNVVHHHSRKADLGMPCRGRKELLFADSVKDDHWLEFVGRKSWIAFSHDEKFHKPGYEVELAAIKQFKVGCFYLWGANAVCREKALCFLKAYDKIVELVASTPRPFIYRIDLNGLISKVDFT